MFSVIFPGPLTILQLSKSVILDPEAPGTSCHLRQQCPIPGYDFEAARSLSPTPTILESEEDIAHDLERRGIKVCDYGIKKLRDRANKQA